LNVESGEPARWNPKIAPHLIKIWGHNSIRDFRWSNETNVSFCSTAATTLTTLGATTATIRPELLS
jgi:hypothetical protein